MGATPRNDDDVVVEDEQRGHNNNNNNNNHDDQYDQHDQEEEEEDDDDGEEPYADGLPSSPTPPASEDEATKSRPGGNRHATRRARKASAVARREARLARTRPGPNRFPGRHKWLGGAVDPATGDVYGVPSNSVEILRLTPPDDDDDDENDDVVVSTLRLPNHAKEGRFKWLRGVATRGHLYCVPAWSDAGVLVVRLRETIGKGRRVRTLPLPPGVRSSEPPPPSRRAKKDDDRRAAKRTRWMWHGAGLSNDAVYCVPSNAARVLKLDVVSHELTEIGPDLSRHGTTNKWYGGIVGRDGRVYGVPYAADGVLRVDPAADDEVRVLGDLSSSRAGWKWHGGLLSKVNDVIYAFPAHESTVLCVDTSPSSLRGNDDDARVRTIPVRRAPYDDDPDDLPYKWLGGAHGADGCVYGMPSDASSILRVDPRGKGDDDDDDGFGTAVTFGRVGLTAIDPATGEPTVVQNKWQGGVLCPADGCVYAVPADANCVLRIDTNPGVKDDDPGKISLLPLPLDDDGDDDPSSVGDKWQGGFLAKDGRIYGVPENIDRIMRITPGKHAKVEYL